MSKGKLTVGAELSAHVAFALLVHSLQYVITFSGSYLVVATKERLSVENVTR
jgi:hypothetical protein